MRLFLCSLLFLISVLSNLEANPSHIYLTASWYSIQSLKQEGTYNYSKGVMANGKQFKDEDLTAACRMYPLGTKLQITNESNKKTVVVLVTDRIGKRFAETRIDLSKMAFSKLDKLEKGLISVKVEVLK